MAKKKKSEKDYEQSTYEVVNKTRDCIEQQQYLKKEIIPEEKEARDNYDQEIKEGKLFSQSRLDKLILDDDSNLAKYSSIINPQSWFNHRDLGARKFPKKRESEDK